MSAIIEILLYKLKPGSGDAFFSIMRDRSILLHQEHGIDVVWHGQSLHDPDGYGLIRAFPNMARMEAVLAAFYACESWRLGPREDIVTRIESATSIVVPMNEEAIDALRRQAAFRHVRMD